MLPNRRAISKIGISAAAALSVLVQYAVMVVPGASNNKGGDPVGTYDAAQDADVTGRVQALDFATGAIVNITTGQIPIPGGTTTGISQTVGYSKKFMDTWLATLPANVKGLIVLTSVGGRGVYFGGSVATYGPWNPDGVGTPWAIGADGAATLADGALYLAQPGIATATKAAIAAAGGTIYDVVFCGSPANQNDVSAPFDVLKDRAKRAITGIRTAWGYPNAPWILPPSVPEWSAGGPRGQAKIDAVQKACEEELPYVAFANGESLVGNQSPTEGIHWTNAGMRLLGPVLYPYKAIAAARSAPVRKPVDWLDTLTGTTLDYGVGLYRAKSAYGTGIALRVSNGVAADTDIHYLSNGELDWGAVLAFAGSGDAWVVRWNDVGGSGDYLVPEGTGKAYIVKTGELYYQGCRPVLAFDESGANAIMLKSNSGHNAPANGAITAFGSFIAAGNRTFATGGQASAAAIGMSSAVMVYRASTVTRSSSVTPPTEPAWVSALGGTARGWALHGYYMGGTTFHLDGVNDPGTSAAGSLTYVGSGGLAVGGIPGQTTKYSGSRHGGTHFWTALPTVGDLARIDAWTQLMVANDAVESAAAEAAIVAAA